MKRTRQAAAYQALADEGASGNSGSDVRAFPAEALIVTPERQRVNPRTAGAMGYRGARVWNLFEDYE